jgi:hypothetical protein
MQKTHGYLEQFFIAFLLFWKQFHFFMLLLELRQTKASSAISTDYVDTVQ